MRDEAVHGMVILNNKFHFHPETAGSAVAIFDKFLSLVKVPSKYLRCVTTTCVYLAAKTLEEDHIIPSTKDMVRTSGCGCSLSEITRMELTILKKLNWSLPTTSSIDSLHIIHAVLLQHHPQLLSGVKYMTPSHHMSTIVRKLMTCLSEHRLLAFRPMTVVVAMLSLELEQFVPGWFNLISIIQKMTNTETQNLVHCREIIATYLSSRQQLITPYQKIVKPTQKSKKRKVELIEEDDNIYDGIKRLYNDEYMSETSQIRGSCSSELHQDMEPELFAPVPTVFAN
ncbi:hypothetical protein LOTGIDRAFT_191775 [Lottia gigantea]|uniref:Cyclin-like domain-containing protein n=1 Tax=Lottia gigantea TaxID=225164 RepID=V4ABJ2_LOTGI|nr:hypothetical protein LOTGIDRAFT_191775 [Lottia gigantea]ESO90681.1 hypothetical protein LOTGIDRAFT_191775 [Lottia gigantea]